MGKLAATMNKAMLPINNKGVISYLIEKFPKDVEIVIAVGYLKEKLIEYIKFAHPDHKITFVNIEKFEGIGSGPGYSMLMCKNHLQCPFIHLAADTIVLEEIPKPIINWMGISKIDDVERFCSVKMDEKNIIIRLDDKVKCDNKHAYIGALGIKDYETFWSALTNNKTLIKDEIQVSNGSNALLEKELKGVVFTWLDTGTIKTFKETEEYFAKKQIDETTIEKNITSFLFKLKDKNIYYFENKEDFERGLKFLQEKGSTILNTGNNMISFLP